MYEGMCQSASSKSQEKPHRESTAEESFVLSTKCSSQKFSSFGAKCLFEPLRASADFTRLYYSLAAGIQPKLKVTINLNKRKNETVKKRSTSNLT